MTSGAAASEANRRNGVQVLAVGIGGASYAIAASEIAEVLPMVECRPLAGAPPWLRGVMNRRGELLPMIDAGLLLGGAPTAPNRASRVIVIEVDVARDRRIGLAVESTGSISIIDFDARGAHPGLARSDGEHLGPVTLKERDVVQLLRLRDLLGDEGWSTLFGRIESPESAHGDADVPHAPDAADAADAAHETDRHRRSAETGSSGSL